MYNGVSAMRTRITRLLRDCCLAQTAPGYSQSDWTLIHCTKIDNIRLLAEELHSIWVVCTDEQPAPCDKCSPGIPDKVTVTRLQQKKTIKRLFESLSDIIVLFYLEARAKRTRRQADCRSVPGATCVWYAGTIKLLTHLPSHQPR